ncbi:YwqG family protein [Terribacillus saccharophilus]|uniref:YwqG family protein n=1 Tax=Terribacillus saccharophilus TaxID=361277 RepID=UPI0039829B9C
MDTKQPLTLPNELEIYRKQIENTIKPFVKVTASKATTNLFQSKFAGNPYMPKSKSIPRDADDKPMKLLAQLNFAEIPSVEAMPEQGILQFFISAEDDVMGLDFDDLTSQQNFRVVYHKDIEQDESQLITDFSFMDDLDTSYFPIEQELALTFSIDYEPVSVNDYKNGELLGESVDLSIAIDNDENEQKELWELYSDTFLGEGHKVGGYPFFTQGDPRDYRENYQKQDTLLLQIDSDSDNGIMWGDVGVANFFITKEDLLQLDFSNVIYTWDCC